MKRSSINGQISWVLAAALATALLYIAWLYLGHFQHKPSIKIGVLHSLSTWKG